MSNLKKLIITSILSYLESGSGLFEGIPPDFGKDPASSAFALLIMRARAFVSAENFVPSAPELKTNSDVILRGKVLLSRS